MKAMILAAGLGTRLLPVTQKLPKALVQVNGFPLLAILLNKLIKSGFNEIIINVHHKAEQVVQFLHDKKIGGANIAISDESGQLLDTGGGIKKARWFLDGKEPFLVHNVDVISEIDLVNLAAAHRSGGNLVTLAVASRKSGRYLLIDNDSRLCGWLNVNTGEKKMAIDTGNPLREMAFSGIHMISPAIFELMSETGKFSIIDSYLRLAAHHPIRAFDQTSTPWFDIGKKEGFASAEIFLKNHPESLPQ
jgi:MurNAc alpha-1-phosphate uridylyltransferase